MKITLYRWRLHSRLLLATLAGLGLTLGHLTAADEPAAAAGTAAAPAAAPVAAPPGTWYVFSPPKDDEVLSSALRIKLLTLAKSFLERDKPELQTRLQTVDNPFYAKQLPPPVPLVSGNSSSSASPGSGEPAAVQKMSDEDKLNLIAEKLEPTGMLEGAGRRLVTFDGNGGGTLDVGQSFSVTVPPDTTPVSVVILDANDGSCTLKLNTTTLPVPYFSKSSAASHPPSPTSPSQPKSRD